MNTTLLSAALLGAALAAAPAIGSAATLDNAPIQIQAVQRTSADRSVDGPTITISYANQSAQPATDVDFVSLNGGQVVDSYEDTGTFTTGAAVQHTFFDAAPAGSDVAVGYVKFADGSTWINPALASDALTPFSISSVSPEHDS